MTIKTIIFASVTLVLSAPLVASAQQASSTDRQIAEAVQILPENLRAGATVVTYDATGARKVLRQGSNFLECQPRMADGFSRCYSKTLGTRRDLEAKLRAAKKSDEEIQSAVAAAVKAGTLPAPSKGMMSYRDYDKRDRVTAVHVREDPPASIDQSDDRSKVKFWAQAWKAAHQKALSVGWLNS